MSTYVGLIFLVFFRGVYVTSLELCNDWNYMEVKEGRDDNTFTCTGLTDRQDVSWVLSKSVVKTCPPVPPSCTALVYGFFNVSRTSNQNYDITILATRISDLSILSENISCRTNTELQTCPLDIIYPAENSQCQVQFNGNTWQITGSCSVSKVRSTRNNYRCVLYQVPEASLASSVGSYSMEVIQEPSGYFSGTCNMTSYLPPEGRYSYYVIILPGKENVSATFNGNNTISLPHFEPYHDCPLYLNEGDTLNCSCFVSDPGIPPGILRWNSTNSTRLELRNLQTSQNGIQSVCSLTWNNTVHQSVSYTLIVPWREKNEFSRGLGIGLGIGLAIAAAVVVATVVIVFCWRRKQSSLKAKGGRENASYSSGQDISFDKGNELGSSSGQEHESAYETIGKTETGQPAAHTKVQESNLSSSKTSKKTGNVYDGLHLQDVGVRSPYAGLRQPKIS